MNQQLKKSRTNPPQENVPLLVMRTLHLHIVLIDPDLLSPTTTAPLVTLLEVFRQHIHPLPAVDVPHLQKVDNPHPQSLIHFLKRKIFIETPQVILIPPLAQLP